MTMAPVGHRPHAGLYGAGVMGIGDPFLSHESTQQRSGTHHARERKTFGSSHFCADKNIMPDASPIISIDANLEHRTDATN